VDGIVRNPDGTIVINNNCIGCGACAERCPYDNIRMADVQQMIAAEKAERSLWHRLRNFARPREMGAVTFDQDDLRPKVAVKCDLCAGYKDGPACVRNCPTGAAFRADGARFFGLGEEIALTPTAARPRKT
jgi:Fe-S-cluster-containing hydrogenase component 2